MSTVAGYASEECFYGDHDCELEDCVCDCHDQEIEAVRNED